MYYGRKCQSDHKMSPDEQKRNGTELQSMFFVFIKQFSLLFSFPCVVRGSNERLHGGSLGPARRSYVYETVHVRLGL